MVALASSRGIARAFGKNSLSCGGLLGLTQGSISGRFGGLKSVRQFSIISDDDIHIVKIPMPSIMDSTEGKVTKWLKNEGESVYPGASICRVQLLSGIDIEIESPFQGVMADIVVKEYIDVPTDETICVLCDSQEAYMTFFERRRVEALEAERAKLTSEGAEDDSDVKK